MLPSLQAILLQSSGPGFLVAGVGLARTLRDLGTMLNAHPTANVAMLGNYNARSDGVLANSVVTTAYTGTFDGGGYAIRNLTIVDLDTNGATALFKNADATSVIQNLTITGSISGSGQLGSAAFACTLGGTIQNCQNYATITNSNTGARVGGLASFVNATGVMTLSNNYGSVQAPATSSYQGGIAGLTWGAVSYCNNYANLANSTTTGAWLGGIIGAVGNTNGTFATAKVSFCINYGNITAAPVNNAGNYTGGCFGNLLDGEVTSCGNYGTIVGGNHLGGVIGRMEVFASSGATPTANDCYNTGSVTGIFPNVGGISGTCDYLITGAWNSGTIIGTQNVGGIVGATVGTEAAATVNHAFNFATVTGSGAYAGGIVGSLAVNTSLDQTYSLGAVTAASNAGGVVGNFAGTSTSSYWNTTTSGNSRGAGNVVTPTGITGKTNAQMLAGILTGFDSDWTRDAGGSVAGGYNYLTTVLTPPAPPTPNPPITILLTGSGNWTVPANWNNSNNIIIAIGEGGNGANATTLLPGRGGGAGARAKNTNVALTPSSSIPYVCGTGSSSTKTTFNTTTIVADFGVAGTTGANGTGGSIVNSTGTSRFAGGAGASSTGAGAAGGGGGAASDAGAGKNGGGAVGNATNAGGGGGGGSGLGTVGSAGTTTAGGDGGTPFDGTAGGVGSTDATVAGGAGSNGSGGGGGLATVASASNGGAGGNGNEYDGVGYGGGGAGAGGLSATLVTGANGGAGGLYGAGGGGGGRATLTPGTGGAGAPGAIIIRYTPA